MTGKVSKASVNYRKARAGRKRCGNCSMFRGLPGLPVGRCTLVAGEISRSDVCDKWEAKR